MSDYKEFISAVESLFFITRRGDFYLLGFNLLFFREIHKK